MRDIEDLDREFKKVYGPFHEFDLKLKKKSLSEQGGLIPSKYEELISLAVAVVKNCSGCINHHVYGALDAGASVEELLQALYPVIRMDGGVALMRVKEMVLKEIETYMKQKS